MYFDMSNSVWIFVFTCVECDIDKLKQLEMSGEISI